ncbi:MAG: phosphoribosylglycinamide formyltransferase [Nanoarchaeota archaeon]|nr:phosphoribosylglycinamide formyltransferase [Nanoarchaeota archaeon]
MTIKLGILASTNATDMQAIIDEIHNGTLDVVISVVIANKECGALEKAKKNGLKAVLIESKDYKERENYDKEVAKELDKNDVELILLIGYMRFLSKWFVDRYKNRIMNIHPSLLPAFAGGMDLNVHEEVLKHGVKITGATLHFVDEGADTGPIILQKAVAIAEDETAETLKEKVQKAEQEIIVEALRLSQEKRLHIEGRIVHVR